MTQEKLRQLVLISRQQRCLVCGHIIDDRQKVSSLNDLECPRCHRGATLVEITDAKNRHFAKTGRGLKVDT